jgi:hypothetical protein
MERAMQYYSLLSFQHWVLGVFLGLGLVLLLYIGWAGIPPRKEETGEPQGGDHDGNNPVAPFLVFIFVGIVLWAFSYMIVIGLRGGSF